MKIDLSVAGKKLMIAGSAFVLAARVMRNVPYRVDDQDARTGRTGLSQTLCRKSLTQLGAGTIVGGPLYW